MNGFVVLGAPGSGKSKVGHDIAGVGKLVYVSSGDIARQMAKENEYVARCLSHGEMAPEDMMRDKIHQVLYDINKRGDVFVLDGFPRSKDQNEWLTSRFGNLIYIIVVSDEDECAHRMIKRCRDDDTAVIIANRMDYYRKHTKIMIYDIANGGSDVIMINNTHDKYDVSMLNFIPHMIGGIK